MSTHSRASPYPCPVETYRKDTYPAISPTLSSLSTKGKNIVITGAGSGIGAATAYAFATSGATSISILGRRKEALEKTKAEIEETYPDTTVYTHAVDLVDHQQVSGAFNSIKSTVGQVDVLVANAGYSPPLKSLEEADSEEWFRAFEINVKGNLNLVKAFIPVASTTASVLHVTAGAVHVPYLPGFSAYAASKLAATRIFDYLHREHPDLFVLSYHPGLIQTGISGNPNALTYDTSKLRHMSRIASSN